MPVPVVGALLVTLGSFSLYAMSILGTTISWRIATMATAAVFAVGLVSGAAAGVFDRWNDLYQSGQAALLASQPAPPAQRVVLPVGRSASELRALAAPLAASTKVASNASAELWFAPFEHAGAARQGKSLHAHRRAAARVQAAAPSAALPDDGAGTHAPGLSRRRRRQRRRLAPTWPPAPRSASSSTSTPAGASSCSRSTSPRCATGSSATSRWSTWTETASSISTSPPGCTAATSSTTAAANSRARRTPSCRARPRPAPLPPRFADVDSRRARRYRHRRQATFESWYFYPEPAVNRLWHNKGGGRFEPETLPGPEGDTLSLLFTDLDGDGWPDLLVGNDFDEPDRIFMNKRGMLVPVKKDDSPLPYSGNDHHVVRRGPTSTTTASPSCTWGQIAMGKMNELPKRFGAAGPELRHLQRHGGHLALRCLGAIPGGGGREGRDNWTIELCRELADPVDQRDCAVDRVLLGRASSCGCRRPPRTRRRCWRSARRSPRDFVTMHDVCEAMAHSPMDYNQSHKTLTGEIPAGGPQQLALCARCEELARRHLEVGRGIRRLDVERKVRRPGTTTAGRISHHPGDAPAPLQSFERLLPQREGRAAGRVHQGGRGSRGSSARRVVRLSRLRSGRRSRPRPQSLRPRAGGCGATTRRRAPGSRCVWTTSAPPTASESAGASRFARRTGRRQIRDIKASGGNQSHDLLVARFGLGDWPQVSSIAVTWPDGQSSVVEKGAFGSGRYRLVRPAQ